MRDAYNVVLRSQEEIPMPVKKKSLVKMAPVSVRFLPAAKAALEKAAKSDDRPVSVLAQKIIVDWLKTNGFLK
jgi:hypothetical protein